MHVSHSPRRVHGGRPHVLSSPHPLPCNWPTLLLIQSPPQKLAPAGTRVHPEASAHRIRRAHISGQKCLQLLGKVAQSVRTDPHFGPIRAQHLPRSARLAKAVGHAERQQRDGKRKQQSVVRPLRPALPVRAALLCGFQLGSLRSERAPTLVMTKIFTPAAASYAGPLRGGLADTGARWRPLRGSSRSQHGLEGRLA